MNNLEPEIINLSSKVGLPIYWKDDFLEVDDRFLTIAKWYEKFVEDLGSFYLNPVTVFPKIIYKTFWLAPQPQKLMFGKIGIRVKFVALYQHIVGVEYPKTKTIISRDAPRIVEPVQGDLHIILHDPYNLYSSPVGPLIVKVKEGEKFVIPPNWAYTLVNTNNSPVFLVEVHSIKQRPNALLKGTKGSPFYLIQRNNNLEVVKNPNYKNIEKYDTVNISKYAKKLYISPKTPIIKQFLRKYEKFSWFYSPTDIDWIELLSDIVSK